MSTNGKKGKKQGIAVLIQLALLLLLCACGDRGAAGYRQITQDEALQMMEEQTGYLIVDVRRPDEFARRHIPGAINVPDETIGSEMPEALPDREQVLLLYCRSGNRSKQAARKLADMGYTNVYEFGGINTWPGETVAEPEEAAPDPNDEPAPDEDSPAEPSEAALDYLVLVDKNHPLPEGWEDEIRLERFTNAVGDEVRVEKTAYEAYLGLKEDLAGQGVYVDLDSAFRSVAEQQAMLEDFTARYGEAYAGTYVAQPGTSEHHTGLALDLFLIVDGRIVYENEDLMRYPEIWARIHALLPDCGFILRYPGGNGYPYEPWHIRYVGPDAAREMAERGLTLEEYLAASP